MGHYSTPAGLEKVMVDEAATLQCGMAFSRSLQAGLVVFLQGDLGAGKTTFVRGILQGLGFLGKVKSPTYALVEPYELEQFTLYHFDLYRFNDDEEWEAAGFREYFNARSVCFVEWPSKATQCLPQADMTISLAVQNLGRIGLFQAHSALGRQALFALNSNLLNSNSNNH